MARRIAFGEAQNEAERWAFDYLAARLPDDIDLLTNIEVLSEAGQPFEVDAIVLGPWAIHFIDVKGYFGQVEAGKDAWHLDGRPIENPLPKANHIAKMFAARLRRRGGLVPWCQGGAFVTGRRGEGVSLVRDPRGLCAWSAPEILEALTKVDYCTSPSGHPVSAEQRELVHEVAGQTEAVLRRQNTIGDFERTRQLHKDEGTEVWLAEYRRTEPARRFILKIVDHSGFGDNTRAEKAESRLRQEAALYMDLSGLAGVPYVAPLIDTGEILALPIRLPSGRSLASMLPDALEPEQRLRALRAAVIALQGLHDRGVAHGRLRAGSVFVTDGGEVELLDIGAGDDDAFDADRMALASLFDDWFDDSEASIRAWLDEPEELETLRARTTAALQPETEVSEEAPRELAVDDVVSDHFRLKDLYRRSETSSSWRARHILGRFDCALTIDEQGEEGLERIQSEFRILAGLHHPGICRVFEAGSIGGDRHFIARAWVDGRSLGGLIRDEGAQPPERIVRIATEMASALEYLHRAGVTHRNISPGVVIVAEDQVVLIDLAISDPADTSTGALAFRDPRVPDSGWNALADLYGLAVTLLTAALGIAHPPTRGSVEWDGFTAKGIEKLPADLGPAVRRLVALNVETEPEDYLGFFGLGEESEPLRELPDEFRARWGISKGYMEFLVVDMVNDGRARSRKQWVLNALRSRRIAGNKTNRGSMNATMSRILAAGIAKKHKTKIRLSPEFLQSWEH